MKLARQFLPIAIAATFLPLESDAQIFTKEQAQSYVGERGVNCWKDAPITDGLDHLIVCVSNESQAAS